MFVVQHCFICRLQDSPVSEDGGIEPRTVATLALAAPDALTTRLDLIHFTTLAPKANIDNNRLPEIIVKVDGGKCVHHGVM